MGDAFDELLKSAGARPRDHHYTFAHTALPQVAFQDPLSVLSVLGSQDADAFLAELWSLVDRTLAEDGIETDLSAEDLHVHRAGVGGRPCAIVQMPEPIAVTEAHFVAIVSLSTFKEIQAGDGHVEIRYFTLERGVSLERGEPRTVLCEWTSDGTHANFGDGPPAELDAFIEAIALRIDPDGYDGFAPRGTPIGHA